MKRIALRTWCHSHPLAASFWVVFVAAWLVWLPMIASAQGLIGLRLPPVTLWLAGVGSQEPGQPPQRARVRHAP